MSTTFRLPPRALRMRSFGGPSVWLEFNPLSRLTAAINLGQGAPGWPPPNFLISALQRAVANPEYSQYARSSGAPELVHEISRVYTPRLLLHSPHASINPLTDVLVTVGASQALYVACTALLDAGDEAVLIAPAFDIYAGAVRLAGARPVFVPLRTVDAGKVDHSNKLVLDMDELARALSKKSKMLILNSPHNPTGKVFSRDEYVEILRVLEDRAPHCVVLSDEVYEHLVFEGHHVPFASVSPAAFERTLSVYSAGKSFSATGLKVGWVIGPTRLMRDLQIAHQFIVFALNNGAQIAIANALREAEHAFEKYQTYYDWIRSVYEKKRDFLVDALRKAGMSPIMPQGAFYVCAQVPQKHPSRECVGLPAPITDLVENMKLEIDPATVSRSDYNICRNLVLRYGVTAIPTSAFFSEDQIGDVELSNNYIRFAFCKPDEVLEQAMNRLCSKPLPLSKVTIQKSF